jgi:hypothetical protein
MWAELVSFLQVCFTGACLPATVLLLLVMLYWLLAIVAGLDLDFFDFDLDVDGTADVESTLGLGFVVLRFFNIGRMPLIIWLSIFALTYWLASMLFDRLLDDPIHREELLYAFQFGIRDLAISLAATKLFTHPLRDKFEPVEPNPPEELIGKQCVITTVEATEAFGQAQVKAEGAPLLLHVRTQEAVLAKGDMAVIVGFDSKKNTYFVKKADPEV